MWPLCSLSVKTEMSGGRTGGGASCCLLYVRCTELARLLPPARRRPPARRSRHEENDLNAGCLPHVI